MKLLSATIDGTVGVLDMQTQLFNVIHRSHSAPINDGSVSSLYEELVTVTEDGYIKIWNLNTLKQHTEFFSGNDPPRCVASHPKRHLVAVGYRSGFVRVFDVDGPAVVAELQHASHAIGSLEFCETPEAFGESELLACDVCGNMLVLDQNWQVVRFDEQYAGICAEAEPFDSSKRATSTSIQLPLFRLANNHRLVLKYYDLKTVALIRAQGLEFLRKYKAPAAISFYDFSFDSAKVLVGSCDAKLRIYSVRGGALLHEVALTSGPVVSAALAPLANATSSAGIASGVVVADAEELGRSLLFTASKNDVLVKVSVLRDSLAGREKVHKREQEQCFLGHGVAPNKLCLTPTAVVAISGTEVIKWKVGGMV